MEALRLQLQEAEATVSMQEAQVGTSPTLGGESVQLYEHKLAIMEQELVQLQRQPAALVEASTSPMTPPDAMTSLHVSPALQAMCDMRLGEIVELQGALQAQTSTIHTLEGAMQHVHADLHHLLAGMEELEHQAEAGLDQATRKLELLNTNVRYLHQDTVAFHQQRVARIRSRLAVRQEEQAERVAHTHQGAVAQLQANLERLQIDHDFVEAELRALRSEQAALPPSPDSLVQADHYAE